MSHAAFIGIGSNIGDRLSNCKRAIERLVDNKNISLIKASSFYETEPWGGIEQDWFINCVVEIEASSDADALFVLIKDIEKDFGRERVHNGGPRTIDIDLLFFNNMIIEGEDLIVPHPLLHKRRFVLMPLHEIAPDLIHPALKKSVADLLREVDDNKAVVRIL